MKQHNEKSAQLSPVERQLRAKLATTTEVEKPLTWQQLSAELPTPIAPRKGRWAAMGLTSLAVAAAAAWLVVIQPSSNTIVPVEVPSQPMLLAGNYTLDHVDQKLQQAYLQGADQAQIDALWQQRKLLTVQEDAS